MVADHHHPARRVGPLEIGAQRVGDLALLVGPALRGGVLRLGAGMEPPLGVERDDPEPLPHVHHHRARAALLRQQPDPLAATLRDAALLPADRVPAVGPHPIPVVIAGNEDRLYPGLAGHVHLRVEPPERLAPPGGAGVRQAARIDVVAEVDDHPLAGGLGQVGGESARSTGSPTRSGAPASPTRNRLVSMSAGATGGTGLEPGATPPHAAAARRREPVPNRSLREDALVICSRMRANAARNCGSLADRVEQPGVYHTEVETDRRHRERPLQPLHGARARRRPGRSIPPRCPSGRPGRTSRPGMPPRWSR